MKYLSVFGLVGLLAALLAGTALAAQPPVGLGTAGSYAVLAGTTITNTGPTTITGDVGLSPGSAVVGFGSVTLSGTQHIADAAALQAKNDLTAAYTDAAGRTPVTAVPTELGGTTLKAGVYGSPTLGLTGTLTLDAEGDASAVFIFQAGSTLITAPASVVALTHGASACNVYWQIGSSATLATTTAFKGHILALTSIALQTGATLQGSGLARNGAVTLDTNVISDAACAPASPTATTSASAATTSRPPATPPTTSTVDLAAGSGGTVLPLIPIVLGLGAVGGLALRWSVRRRHGGAR